LPGLKEDITELILNLKSVQLSLLNGMDYVEAKICKKGACIVYAKDIESPNLKVFNKDQYICTLSSNISFKAILTVEEGKGYLTSTQNRLETSREKNAGIIWLDTNFSPIKKVNYNVTNSRVGQRTDYDKLVFEIWTNNSIDPERALGIAANILQEQISIFINVPKNLDTISSTSTNNEIFESNNNLFKRIDEIELSVRSANCLANAGIKKIGDLVQKTEIEMLKTKNFGRKSLKEIKDVLNEMNLSLNMKLTGWNDFNNSKN
jgi:DNA-directed RNA polymerase subunit alpha